MYTSHMLGHGIDVTATDPFLHATSCVRSVLTEPSNRNVEEILGDKGREGYKETVLSKMAYAAEANALISDSVSSHLKLSGGLQYYRDNTSETITEGIIKCIITYGHTTYCTRP